MPLETLSQCTLSCECPCASSRRPSWRPNKIAVDVRALHGPNKEKYMQQTPFLCLRALMLSFAEKIFVHHGSKTVFQLDAAADNRGTGNLGRSMDSMSNPNSVHDCIMVTRTAWQAAGTDLEIDGMLYLMGNQHFFSENRKFSEIFSEFLKIFQKF